jgi:MoaA/NifB/PqqE/SkfB family radical SAM enzyme
MDLKQLYLEPTSNCNLECAMCSRRQWDDVACGDMTSKVFEKTLAGMPDSVERIVFGGYGEPLAHPDIVTMVSRAKQTGATVEIITNGTLLTRNLSRELVDAGLDMVWISLDSMSPESYEDIRAGSNFELVMKNIDAFNTARGFSHRHVASFGKLVPKLGIAFVLMKRNLGEYEKLLEAAFLLGVNEIKATHLIPYAESQQDEVLFDRIIGSRLYHAVEPIAIKVDMPLLDTRDVSDSLLQLYGNPTLAYSKMGRELQLKMNRCRFIEDGIAFVRWDGAVAPCMALLHDNTVWQHRRERHIKAHSFGNVETTPLTDIWNSAEYVAYREKVTEFAFSPCVRCGNCERVPTNERDCSDNTFPVCGACLWATGLFQCP